MSNIMIGLCRVGASSFEKNVCTTRVVTNVSGNIIDSRDVSQALKLGSAQAYLFLGLPSIDLRERCVIPHPSCRTPGAVACSMRHCWEACWQRYRPSSREESGRGKRSCLEKRGKGKPREIGGLTGDTLIWCACSLISCTYGMIDALHWPSCAVIRVSLGGALRKIRLPGHLRLACAATFQRLRGTTESDLLLPALSEVW